MKVFSKNEYSKLKSIIVGRAEYSCWPVGDNFFDEMINISTYTDRPTRGQLPDHVIQEAKEDCTVFIDVLRNEGIEVYRPEVVDFKKKVTGLNFTTSGMSTWSARDLLLTIGNMVIECPTPFVSRQHEIMAYNKIREKAIADGCNWISAPTAPMNKEDFVCKKDKIFLTENYPIFDAANVVKLDDKLLYLKSSTGNMAGARWLQKVVGSEFEVVVWDKVYAHAHIDSTLLPIGKNTVLLNASRVKDTSLPLFLKDWKKIWIEDCIPNTFYKFPYASKWIALNILCTDPETIVVDLMQNKLIEQLQKENFRILPVQNRHSRTLGGGFHCMTCDLERQDV